MSLKIYEVGKQRQQPEQGTQTSPSTVSWVCSRASSCWETPRTGSYHRPPNSSSLFWPLCPDPDVLAAAQTAAYNAALTTGAAQRVARRPGLERRLRWMDSNRKNLISTFIKNSF